MREPNLCFPSQNRAAVCITSALYDRRALDCTATLPLINSLTHLAYLTSTSPRIREILCVDGGLERLVRILNHTSGRTDRFTLWKWTLAFQSIVNVGVRGTEQIRTKVVEAGVILFVLTILGNFTKTLEFAREKKESTIVMAQQQQHQQHQQEQETDKNTKLSQDTSLNNNMASPSLSTRIATLSSSPSSSSSKTIPPPASSSSSLPSSSSSLSSPLLSSRANRRRSTFPYVKIDAAKRRYNRIHRDKPESNALDLDNIFHREEDVLLSLQLLAYLSKYPHIRDLFHSAYDKNVFSVVERFCRRIYPGPIQYWAGVIMRNACRKHEARGGIRRCANMSCGKWEVSAREFAKCRRCRKAKYCSKACQSKAWADGHRWWCVDRHSAAQNVRDPRPLADSNVVMPRSTVEQELDHSNTFSIF